MDSNKSVIKRLWCTLFQSCNPMFETIFRFIFGTPIRNWWSADPIALLDLYLLSNRYFFNFGKRKNHTWPGLGCRKSATIQWPFQTSKTMLQLRICGLEHCHVTNGHAGDQFLNIRFYFCSQFFQNHILKRSYQTSQPFGTAICMSGPEFLKKMENGP